MRLPSEMTADELVAELLNHFRVFHKPDSPEEAAWSRSMAAVLGGYEPTVLARACERILRTRKNDRFPLPAEISAICAEIVNEDRRPALLVEEVEARKARPRSRERQSFVIRQLMSGEMGARSVREGWTLPLFDYCCQHNKLPTDDREIAKLKADAESAARLREACIRGDGFAGVPGLQQSCARMADKMDARRRLIEAVMEKRVPIEALWERLDKWEREIA